jgi:hypothetical protein
MTKLLTKLTAKWKSIENWLTDNSMSIWVGLLCLFITVGLIALIWYELNRLSEIHRAERRISTVLHRYMLLFLWSLMGLTWLMLRWIGMFKES